MSVVIWASLVAQMVKNLLAVWETWIRSLGWEDPLDEGTKEYIKDWTNQWGYQQDDKVATKTDMRNWYLSWSFFLFFSFFLPSFLSFSLPPCLSFPSFFVLTKKIRHINLQITVWEKDSCCSCCNRSMQGGQRGRPGKGVSSRRESQGDIYQGECWWWCPGRTDLGR